MTKRWRHFVFGAMQGRMLALAHGREKLDLRFANQDESRDIDAACTSAVGLHGLKLVMTGAQ